MPDPVSYFELGGQDATGLREFYAGLFGWKIQTPLDAAETGDYSRVVSSKGGIAGSIVRTSGNMPPNYVMFYVGVDDLQASLDKAESLGGKTMVPPMPVPIQGGEGHIAVFIDPAGNTIGLRKL